MPIHFRENQYQGINAHLHSFLQDELGGWESFHTEHIAALRSAIDAALPSGYYVRSDKSLQLHEDAPSIEPSDISITRLDLTLYGSPASPVSTMPATADTPTATIPLIDVLSDEDYLHAAVILKHEAGSKLVPVTRFELLSPSNKPWRSHFRQYVVKRDETLARGICLVELDYLHQTRSPNLALPSYPKRENGAFPYSVLVSNPRPHLSEGHTQVYGFRVDDPMPRVRIPLMGDDSFVFDFGAVYHRTFLENRFYGEIAVDYEQKPVRFETYDDEDQRRIEARMRLVLEQLT